MGGEKEQWFGPGETARRLGVTTKALGVYEREGLVVPRGAESQWRLYGPAQISRLHQIIVLRDLGLPLKSCVLFAAGNVDWILVQPLLKHTPRSQRRASRSERAFSADIHQS